MILPAEVQLIDQEVLIPIHLMAVFFMDLNIDFMQVFDPYDLINIYGAGFAPSESGSMNSKAFI